MKPEQRFRKFVVAACKKYGAVPVENPAMLGTPDVYCSLGWMELKVLPNWPKNIDSHICIRTFTPQQRVFAIRAKNTRILVWLVILIPPTIIVVRGHLAARYIASSVKQAEKAGNGYWTAKELIKNAECVMEYPITADLFRRNMEEVFKKHKGNRDGNSN